MKRRSHCHASKVPGFKPRQGGQVSTQSREEFGYLLICSDNPGLENRGTRYAEHTSPLKQAG